MTGLTGSLQGVGHHLGGGTGLVKVAALQQMGFQGIGEQLAHHWSLAFKTLIRTGIVGQKRGRKTESRERQRQRRETREEQRKEGGKRQGAEQKRAGAALI